MELSFVYSGNETVGAMVVSRLEAAGCTRTDDVAHAEAIITYCTSQTALEDAYFDEQGLVQAAGEGALLIDLSASTHSFARELNAVAVVSDLMSVEAPLVVVDVARADAFGDRDNLVCFVGGDEEAVAEARPVLEAIAGTVQETGGAGSAQLARAAYTLQTTAQVISAVEADALYRAVRRSSASLDQATERVGAATPVAEQVLAAVNTGRFDGTYTVEMFMAELSAALTAADDVDLILPQAEACLHLLELLAVIGGADKAPSALALVYGEEAACAENGIAAFTGDGTNPDVMTMATKAIGNADGCGVPTIKPWNIDTIKEKMAQAKASGCFAVAMDVDAAGLPFLKNMTPPAGSKSVAELAEIVKLAERPFIVKGVMTVKGALKAKEAGAAAIVVSNHGGRVLDQCPATAEVLPEIAAALKGTGVKVLVDGGIRTGVDVFKALALGADGVLICRPFVTAVYGGGEEGVKCYIDKLAGELADTMQMCGAHSIEEITPDMVRV